MVFLSNPQVWHLPGTWSGQPIDGPYLGMTSIQLSWLAGSLLTTLFLALGGYVIQMNSSKRKKSS